MTKKRKIIFTFLISIFSLAAVFVGTHYVVKMRQTPSKSSAGSGVSLYFDPQNPTLDRNSDFTLNVKVNPALERVTGIELYLNFDKDRVILEGIESVPAFSAGVAPKTFLKDPVIDNSQGTASATIGVLPEAPVGSVSDVVIIRGKTKNVPGNTSIVINQDSKAAAIDKTSNVIESYGEASLNITAPTPTSTPTPTTTPTVTPTSSPTPTPTSSSTSTPTPSPTATPTPTSSPTPTPTSIPTATPIVSPTGSPEAKAGDVNGDNLINIVDIGIIIDNYGDSPANPKADLNGDGKANIVDIGIVIDHYGE